jgi:hypothetical protein
VKTKTRSHAMDRIRKLFPQVTQIIEAKEPLVISVIEEDALKGRKKDPMGCALVRACKRLHLAEGAIIGLGNSYLIKGNIATRYKTSGTVSREITSFDRHQDFAPGKDYRLSAISPGSTLANTIKSNRKAYRKRKVAVQKEYRDRMKAQGKSSRKLNRAQPPIAVLQSHRTIRVRKLKDLA